MLEAQALLGLYLLLYQPVQYKLVSPVELLVRHLLTLCMLEAQALLGLYLLLFQPVRYRLVSLVELLVHHSLTLCMLEVLARMGLYLPLYQPALYRLVSLVELLVLPYYCCFFQIDSDSFYFLLLMFPYLDVILEKMG